MTASVAFVVLGLLLLGLVFVGLPRLFAKGAMSFRVARALNADRNERTPPGTTLERYHAAVAGLPHTSLDERTWRDLDLDALFHALDYTRSRPGQQYLYHLLRTPQFSPDGLIALNASIDGMSSNAAMADDVRRVLGQADDRRAGYLVELIFGDLPDRPRFWWIFPILTLAAILCIAGTFVWPKLFGAVVALCIINILTQLYYRRRVETLVPAIHQIPAFLHAARTLGAMQLEGSGTQRAILAQTDSALTLLKRATGWLRFEPTESANEFMTTVYAYANLLLLIDVNAFVFAINAARVARPQLQAMFTAMGHVDVAQSVAEWRRSLPAWCTPDFSATEKSLSAQNVFHPLLTTAVANTLHIDNSSVLITGSNMSGKTTFVRTLGVNAVLAQTLNTVCATRWRAPFVCVGASIGRADSLLDGKSYYLAEVEGVRQLIRAKTDGRQHLYLLDEIFRGTNTEERVAAAYAVLAYLDRGRDIVVVATHDMELLDMLGPAYAAYHFREQITAGALTFDFIMRPGRATTRNAIALLELMEYPAEVVENARRAVDRTPR